MRETWQGKRTKSRNKARAQRQRKEPSAKRRKTSKETYVGVQEQLLQTQRQEEQEKRKPEEHSDAPPAKRKAERSTQNINEIFMKMNSKNGQEECAQEQETGQEQGAQELPPPSNSGVHYGQEHAVELVNWEEEFKAHVQETKRPQQESETRIEKAQKSEKSWELLKECTRYLKENDKSWKQEGESNSKNSKTKRLKAAQEQKQETLTRTRQRKMEETWKKITKERQQILQAEEQRMRRFD